MTIHIDKLPTCSVDFSEVLGLKVVGLDSRRFVDLAIAAWSPVVIAVKVPGNLSRPTCAPGCFSDLSICVCYVLWFVMLSILFFFAPLHMCLLCIPCSKSKTIDFRFWNDMFEDRDFSLIADLSAYCAGFPCTPFLVMVCLFWFALFNFILGMMYGCFIFCGSALNITQVQQIEKALKVLTGRGCPGLL